MAKSTDWLPAARTLILAMCRNWLAYMTSAVRTLWGVPEPEFTELGTLFSEAETFLQKAQDETERTHVITVECHAAFKALSAKMRFFKDRYFKIPPLTEGDWVALGFKIKDPHPSPVPVPEGTPSVTISYTGAPHALIAHLGPLPGSGAIDSNSDYGYAIYIGIMPPGGATLEQAASEKHYLMKPPIDGTGLMHHRFTRRRKEKIVFNAAEAGMTVYICCRYENGKGEVGQWGPVASAVIS